MIDISRYQKAFASLPEGITEAEVNADKTTKTALHIKNGQLDKGRSGSVTKYYVRATAGRTGVAYTEKPDDDPAEMIKNAAECATYTAESSKQVMNPEGVLRLGKATKPDSVENAIRFGILCEKLAEEQAAVASVTGCQVNLCSRELHTVNSLGLDAAYESHWAECILDVVMKREGTHVPGYAYTSAGALDALNAGAIAAAAASDGSAYDGGGLAPCAIPSGRYDAVLSSRVMRNILMTAWMEFSGQAMLTGNSIYKGKQGAQISGNALHIINAPSHPMLGQAWLTDSEGTAVPQTKIVENGVLRMPLYTLDSGRKADMPSTGSAGRVARMTGNPPIVLTTVPAVFYVEPGVKAQEDLVKEMNTGILLTYSLDLFHSVNVASGEFSIPCGGIYYENGNPMGSVSQMTVAGNLKDLFGNIERLANDLDFDNFYLETYTIGSPSALVRGLAFGS